MLSDVISILWFQCTCIDNLIATYCMWFMRMPERYIIKSCRCQPCKIHRTISDFAAMCEQYMKARLILRLPFII